MKHSKKIIGTLFVTLMGVAISCSDSFLDVKPTASITETQLTSQKGLEGMLVGAYSMLTGRGGFYAGSSNWVWGSVLGGEANKGTNSGDQSQINEIQNYNAQPTNGSVLEKYQACYEGITRVNALLRVLPNADPTVAADTRTRIEAEAKFLRAFYYFELKRLFDDVPFVTEEHDYGKGIDEIGNDQDLWPKIEDDMRFAAENLPATQGAIGRANEWAAKAFLGKILLYQEDYAGALALFEEVIDDGTTQNGTPYALVPNYGTLWRIATDQSAEIVFAIQASAGTGTINNANPEFVLNFPYNGGPAGCCGFNQPSFDLMNSFRTDANGLPLLDGSHNTGANQVITDQGIPASSDWSATGKYVVDSRVSVMAAGNVARQYRSLTGTTASPNEGNDPLTSPANWVQTWEEDLGNLDPRIDHAGGRRGIPYLDHGRHPGIAWIRDQNYGGPYAPKKFIWAKAEEASGVDKSSWTPGYTALNVPVIRFADVLLMAAECEIERAGGDLEAARDYINQIRTRAANSIVMDGAFEAANYNIDTYNAAFANQAEARAALRMERKLELNGEGHRFFDLVRWGVADAVLDAYLTYESSKVSDSGFDGQTFTAGKSELLPIPQREIDIIGADKLKQNPGYN